MRHRKLNKRFGRNLSQRRELMRSLVRSLFISYGIKTTLEKAKEARKLSEKVVTLAKKATLSDIRAINDVLQDRGLTKKILNIISPLFKERNGGYTRVVRTGFRRGDGTPMAILELVEKPVTEKKPGKPKKEKPAVQAEEEKKPAVQEIAAKEPKPKKEARPEPEKPKAAEPGKKVPKEEPKKPEIKPKEGPKPQEKKPSAGKEGFFGKFKKFFKKEQ